MTGLEKHAKLFNLIAPIYNFFFQGQVRNYRNILSMNKERLGLPHRGKVLDIGCGTGAFLYCFAELGFQCTGIDFAESMLRVAKKSTQEFAIDFQAGDVTQGLDFADGSFDLVLASYVLHGLKEELRNKIYFEASRLTRNKILFYDYNQYRKPVTDIVEWAEGGDYFNFVRLGEKEMRAFFKDVEKFDVGPQTAIYLCSPRESGVSILP
ncbi:MAG: class I SAM-dependent methyltransferase [Desulfitobacteriaceae bacterium]